MCPGDVLPAALIGLIALIIAGSFTWWLLWFCRGPTEEEQRNIRDAWIREYGIDAMLKRKKDATT